MCTPSNRSTSVILVSIILLAVSYAGPARASCASPANPIEAENCLTGNPSSQWDIDGAGDSSIQGFATDISVNRGGTISFKVDTDASSYHLDIYRMGYYGGMGARKVTTVNPSATLPQNQPNCLTNAATGLMDCGNWAVSASWTVPANATSGIYFARLVRSDTQGASHVFFIVRDDSSHSDLLFQTSDTTWQAYNAYGGNSLYTGAPAGRAYKVSYNRPFTTRCCSYPAGEPPTFVFNAEYPMVRWLEANGYDVSYFTGVDAERNGALIQNHKVWMSNGHDEYWSGGERTNVTAARDAGVHLAFFSGNTMFWKTRWENSVDGSATPYRTLVCYKETHANAVIDPADPPTWTGTWRDPRFSPPADGGRPENAVVGTIFRMNGGQNGTISVPQADGKMRFWRNTTVATLGSGQTASLAPGTIGAEFDDDEDNGFRPAGLFELSSTSVTDSSNYLLDYGSTYGAGTAVHKVTLYKAPSGALVFATGTYQWAWGLDANHDDTNLGSTTNAAMKQATVNLFADMGAQPATLQSGLVAAVASTDATPPSSTITSPANGAIVTQGTPVTISGTAADTGGGVVAGVEVSVDGGTTWHPATGRASWTYNWTPGPSSPVTIRSRAVDDSGNLESPSAGVTVTLSGGGSSCSGSCTSIWTSTAVPVTTDGGPDSAVELGVKFTSDVAGTITGIRFYKASTNTGTHVGDLWTSTGTLLASATFAGESASGWQQVNLSPAVAITAGTVYVASYHTTVGHYSDDDSYFSSGGVDSPPLHALADGVSGPNGVYAYGAGSTFPNQGFSATNYWVDVVFSPGQAASPTATFTATSTATTGPSATTTATGTATLTATATPSGAATATQTATATATATRTLTATPSATPTRTPSASPTTTPSPITGTITIWGPTATPATPADSDSSAVELGVKFTSDVNGQISGIRYYKGSTNTGTHTGTLWSSTGTQLATATFSGETASGWQQVNFTTPVAITAGTVYVASYHTTTGHYAGDTGYFAAAGFDHPPLHALRDGASGGNGVYIYGAHAFPTNTYQSTNYWVDVVFSQSAAPTATVTSTATTGPSLTATATAPSTATATATATTAPTGTATATRTATGTSTATATVAPSATPTVTIAPSPTSTATTGPSATPTGTSTATGTATATRTATATASATQTGTATGTSTSSPTPTATSPTAPTPTPTQTVASSLVVDTSVAVDGTNAVTTASFHTAQPGELLLAFVASDGPTGNTQTVTVSGAGLTWTLVKRANSQLGTAEIWQATAASVVTGTVTSTQARTGYDQSLTVVAFRGSGGVGASATAGAGSGAPTVSLVTTKAGSLVFGVGNDWDNAIGRTLGPNQVFQHQWIDTGIGDTYWVQNLTPPTGAAGSTATLNDTAPTGDRWNFAAVEVTSGG